MTLNDRIANNEKQLLEIASELIKIKSVEGKPTDNCPFGEDVRICLDKCLEICSSMGFETVNVDNMVGYCEYGKGEEMIAVLGHLDVVPEGDSWNYPPFGAVVDNGRLYGRGSIDNKGPVAASICALKAIKDEGLDLSKRIRVIFGTNEETGSKDLKHYVEKGEEMPLMGFTPDGEYPIINGEKGIINTEWKKTFSSPAIIKSIKGGVAQNVVPDYAKAEILSDEKLLEKAQKISMDKVVIKNNGEVISIEAFGESAHGSTPEKGENAIGRLFKVLNMLEIGGEEGKFISFMNDFIGMESDGKALGINICDDISGKLTFLLGTIEGDCKAVSFKINMRYPVTFSIDDCFPHFKMIMEQNGLEEVSTLHKKKLYMEPLHPLIKKLSKVYEQETGDKAELLSIGGGTYAKAIPNTVAFGPIFPGDEIREHKPDEYIEVKKLVKNAQIIAAAMYELAK